MEPILIRASDAARMLSVGKSLFYQMAADGRLGPLPLSFGRRKLWRVAELKMWAKKNCPPRCRWQEIQAGGAAEDDEPDSTTPPRPDGLAGKDRLLRPIATIALASVALTAILFILTNLSIQFSHSLHQLSATKLGILCAIYGLSFRAIYRLVRLVSGDGVGEDEHIGYAKPKEN